MCSSLNAHALPITDWISMSCLDWIRGQIASINPRLPSPNDCPVPRQQISRPFIRYRQKAWPKIVSKFSKASQFFQNIFASRDLLRRHGGVGEFVLFGLDPRPNRLDKSATSL